MDRFRHAEWFFESNQGEPTRTNGLDVYSNSFLGFQNHKTGISLEFHTYEAVEMMNPENQKRNFYVSGDIFGSHTNFMNPIDENSTCSSYKGRVKAIHLHGVINIQPSISMIPVERLGNNDPILWFNEILFFQKNTVNEKSSFSVKVRAMPTCFYALARMSCFLNQQKLRSLETRVFHSYGANSILRVFTVKENTVDELNEKGVNLLGKGDKIEEMIYSRLDTVISFTDEIALLV
ncbi:hypothetical protein SteCoe_2638 [Stentor coeruleus]|uniref:Uncharacterized protein n=1 Tax=Stentor coeruleus TaxID=5963 RepID=A0A1R2CZ87_9CILI|nr:hypothetical protein SteCoe_2638 [Stentor coeruleus]